MSRTVERVVDEAAHGHRNRIAIAIPAGTSWTLPAYELAIMTASALELRGAAEAVVQLVTPEREPLWIFGSAASRAMRDLLGARGVGLRTRVQPGHAGDRMLWLRSGDAVAADTVIALPRLTGPALDGLPADADGFIPTDAHGCVAGADGVYAAGDATTFPVKQGGLAAQQADAAAATIAAELGAARHAAPFGPVLRGLLLTGGAPLYLRAELDSAGAASQRRRSRRCTARCRRARCGGRPARSPAATSRPTWRRRAPSRSATSRCATASPARPRTVSEHDAALRARVAARR